MPAQAILVSCEQTKKLLLRMQNVPDVDTYAGTTSGIYAEKLQKSLI